MADAADSMIVACRAARWYAQHSASAALTRAGDQPSRDEPKNLKPSCLGKVEMLSEVDGALNGELSFGSSIFPGLNAPHHFTTSIDI